FFDRHDGRFIEHDTASPHVHQGGGRAEVNREVIREPTENPCHHTHMRVSLCLRVHVKDIFIDDLSMFQFVSDPKPPIIPDDQKGFDAQDHCRSQPSHIRDLPCQVTCRDRDVSDDGVLKPGSHMRVRHPCLEPDQTLPDAAACEPVCNQKVPETRPETVRRSHFRYC